MGFENVGRVWTPDSLKQYLTTINPPAWCKSITLHHCAAPSLAQRPHGFLVQHLRNLQHYYQNTLGWRSAPHLFVDEDQLWGMCDFRRHGIHAVSFNATSLGIEVLGDYDKESPKSGRGLDCWKTTAAATQVLADWLNLPLNESTILFHRDDPKTNKSCPGRKVTKDWVLNLLQSTSFTPDLDLTAKPDLGVTLPANQWRFLGERWCVPVRAYLLKKGVPEATIAANLKKIGKDFYYGTELLEGAFYDIPSSSTWAPAWELIALRS